MMNKNLQSGLESILALTLSLEGNRDKELTAQKSEENIVNNLINVCGFNGIKEHPTADLTTMNGKGIGSGLLITTDGWVLTAYHNIEKYLNDWKRIMKEEPPTSTNISSWMSDMTLKYAIVDQKRRAYPIDPSVYGFIPSLDIALIKGMILEKPEPIIFKVAQEDLRVGDEIKLFGLRDQKQYNQFGKVSSSRRDTPVNDAETSEVTSTIYDTFLTDAYGVPGFSGGVFTTMKGEFAGLSLYTERNVGREIGHAGGAKVRNIAGLVKDMVYSIGMAIIETV